MIDAIAFATPEDWAAWLADHHASSTEVWLRIYKKSSGIPSIDWGQAVIEALAWGWIDGVKKSVSETEWAQRFTPRKPGSAWSRTNRSHAEKLIAEGRMRPAGLAHVAVAQANGRWESAYAGSRTAEMPEDFLQALAEGPQAARDEYEGGERAQSLRDLLPADHSQAPGNPRQADRRICGDVGTGRDFALTPAG